MQDATTLTKRALLTDHVFFGRQKISDGRTASPSPSTITRSCQVTAGHQTRGHLWCPVASRSPARPVVSSGGG